MITKNQTTYSAKARIKFPVELSNFRRHSQKSETFDMIPSREFLGIFINIGEPIEYSGGDLLAGSILKGQFNLIYLPITEYAITFPPGLHHSLAIRIDPSSIERSAKDFSFLQSFLDKTRQKLAAIALDKHLFIPNDMQNEIEDLLCNVAKDELVRDLSLDIKASEIYLDSLCDMADLIPELKIGYSDEDKIVVEAADYDKIKQAHDYLVHNFKYIFRVDLLAEMVGMDKYRLRKGFKKVYKTTMQDFIVECRMNKALEYLQDSQLPIGKISYSVGYKRQRYFTAVFKKVFGKTPRQARTEQAGISVMREKK